MANLKVTNQELETILSELESDLSGFLGEQANRLAKAREEDGSPSPGMGALSASGSSPEGSPSAGSPSAGSPSASAGSPSPAPEGAPGAGSPGVEGAPGEGAPPMEGAPEGAPGEGAPGEEGPVDPAALEEEYRKLPPEELKAHYLAAKAALFSIMGGEGAAAGASPTPAPSAAPPAGPPAGGAPMAMGEYSASAEKAEYSASSPSASSPSASSPSVAKSEMDDLKAQLDAVTKILGTIVGKPMQKAVTGTSFVAKSEEPVKKPINSADITVKLSELTRDPSLKKSDRDLINRYYEGTANVAAIEHLLK